MLVNRASEKKGGGGLTQANISMSRWLRRRENRLYRLSRKPFETSKYRLQLVTQLGRILFPIYFNLDQTQ